MKRSPLPPRSSSLPPGNGPSRRVPLRAVSAKSAAARQQQPQRRTQRDTGFSRAVKLQIRTRAGQGDPDNAVCECCGTYLGRYGGQVQHIVARGMGGTSNPVLGTAANGGLLCGTAQSGDHGLAESRDPGMRRKGFWLPQGTDPRRVPMTLWSGAEVWRPEHGTDYLFEQPSEVAA